jgi:hypothetical protein
MLDPLVPPLEPLCPNIKDPDPPTGMPETCIESRASLLVRAAIGGWKMKYALYYQTELCKLLIIKQNYVN